MILTVTLNPCIDKTYIVENFKTGVLNRAVSVRTDAAGKGINVSRFLTVMGVDNIATGFMAGENGSFIKKQLDDIEKVKNRFIDVSGNVRVNAKIIDRAENKMTELNEPSFTVNEAELNELKKIIKGIGSGNTVIFSGSAPDGVDAAAYAGLLKFAKDCGNTVYFDADGENFKRGIEEKPFFVKPNDFELSLYAGEQLNYLDDIKTVAKSINKIGIEYVAVTLGGKGALLSTKDKTYYAPPLKVKIKSTVGAGDAFTAGFTYAMERGLDERAALCYAMALSAAKVETEGTVPPTHDMVMNNLKKVIISEG